MGILLQGAGLILMTFTLAGMCGCGAKSYDYHPHHEIPEGPGVFSGDDGALHIYKSKEAAADDAAGEATAAPYAHKDADVSAPAATGTEKQVPPEYKDFMEYQAWKQEKADFENFQKWKQSNKGAKQYQEFLEWKRWQEYRRWQEQQKQNKNN